MIVWSCMPGVMATQIKDVKVWASGVILKMVATLVSTVLTGVNLLVTGMREIWDTIAAIGGTDDPLYDIVVRALVASTVTTVIDPFTPTGLKAGWRLDRTRHGSEPLDCSYEEASPNAVGSGTHWCGTTADAANACWSGQTAVTELWCLDYTNPESRTLPSMQPRTSVTRRHPSTPNHYSWDGRADGLTGAYGCLNDAGVCATEGYAILEGRGVPPIDKSGSIWHVRIGLLGDPRMDFPAPERAEVKRAWFIAGHVSNSE